MQIEQRLFDTFNVLLENVLLQNSHDTNNESLLF